MKKTNKYNFKIKKGDTVSVTTGKDKGKQGKVEKIFPQRNKVLVTGVNQYKRHVKPKGEGKPGGIITINKPLALANVILICPKCQKNTKVGFQFDKLAKKYRICKKCREVLK